MTTLGDVIEFMKEMRARTDIFGALPKAVQVKIAPAATALSEAIIADCKVGSMAAAYCLPCETELGEASIAAFARFRAVYGCKDGDLCSTTGCEGDGATG